MESRKRLRESEEHLEVLPEAVSATDNLLPAMICEAHGCEAKFFCRTCDMSTGSFSALCALKCIPKHHGHDWNVFKAETIGEVRLDVVQRFWPPIMRESSACGCPTSAPAATRLLLDHDEPPIVSKVRALERRYIAESDALPAEAEAASAAIRREFGAIIAAAEERRDTLLARVASMESAKRHAIETALVACDTMLTASEGLTQAWAAVKSSSDFELAARASSLKAAADSNVAAIMPESLHRVDSTIHAVIESSTLLDLLGSAGDLIELATARLAKQIIAKLPFRDSLLPLLLELRELTTTAHGIGDSLPQGGCLSAMERTLALYGSKDAIVVAAALDCVKGLLLCDDAAASVWNTVDRRSPLFKFFDGVLLALRSFPLEAPIRDTAVEILTLACTKKCISLDDTAMTTTLASALSANAASSSLGSLLDLAHSATSGSRLSPHIDHVALLEAVTLILAGSDCLPLPLIVRAVSLLRNINPNSYGVSSHLRQSANAALVSILTRFKGRELPTADAIAVLADLFTNYTQERDVVRPAMFSSIDACAASVSVSQAFLQWSRSCLNERSLWTPDLYQRVASVIQRHVDVPSIVTAGIGILCGMRSNFTGQVSDRSMIKAMLCVLRKHARDEAIVRSVFNVIDAMTCTPKNPYGGAPCSVEVANQVQNISVARECRAASEILTALQFWARPCEVAALAFSILERMMGDASGVSDALQAGVVDKALAVIEQFSVATATRHLRAATHRALVAIDCIRKVGLHCPVIHLAAFFQCAKRTASAILAMLSLPQSNFSELSLLALRVAELLSWTPLTLGPEFWPGVCRFVRYCLHNRIDTSLCCWAVYCLVSRGMFIPEVFFRDVIEALRGDASRSARASKWAALALTVCRPSRDLESPSEAVAAAVRAVVEVALSQHSGDSETATAGLKALVRLLALDPVHGPPAAVAARVWPALSQLLRDALTALRSGEVTLREARVVDVCVAAKALLQSPLPPHDLAAIAQAALDSSVGSVLAEAAGLAHQFSPPTLVAVASAQSALVAAQKVATAKQKKSAKAVKATATAPPSVISSAPQDAAREPAAATGAGNPAAPARI